MVELYDKKHAEFLKHFLEHEHELLVSPEGTILDVEYYFNYYGERGNIDIFTHLPHGYCSKCDRFHDYFAFYELKPYIYDLGDTIRQIKRYYYVLEKTFPNCKHNYGKLVLPLTIENIEHIYDNYAIYESAFKQYQSFGIMLHDATLDDDDDGMHNIFYIWLNLPDMKSMISEKIKDMNAQVLV